MLASLALIMSNFYYGPFPKREGVSEGKKLIHKKFFQQVLILIN